MGAFSTGRRKVEGQRVHPFDVAGVGVVGGLGGLVGAPKPTRSGATARSPAAVSTGIILRYRNDQLGSPCSNSTTGPSAGPSSTHAIRSEPPSPSGTSASCGG